MRAIADCEMYGVLTGGPVIDVSRCDELLALGEARGVRPSRPDTELAIGYIQAFNQAAKEAATDGNTQNER